MKLSITVKQARALLLIAPKSDVRYYLKGVHADFGTGRLVATDGARLLITKACVHSCERKTPGETDVIIPRDSLDTVAKGGKTLDLIDISFDDEKITLARENGITMQCAPVDGRFPDISRVIPDSVSGEVAQFDHKYLAECAKALELCDAGRDIYLAHNGNSAAIMGSNDADSFCIIMPRRTDCPDWIKFDSAEAA